MVTNTLNQHYFVVDTSRDKQQKLPGFSKEVWPDIANSDWDEQVDAHFQGIDTDYTET